MKSQKIISTLLIIALVLPATLLFTGCDKEGKDIAGNGITVETVRRMRQLEGTWHVAYITNGFNTQSFILRDENGSKTDPSTWDGPVVSHQSKVLHPVVKTLDDSTAIREHYKDNYLEQVKWLQNLELTIEPTGASDTANSVLRFTFTNDSQTYSFNGEVSSEGIQFDPKSFPNPEKVQTPWIELDYMDRFIMTALFDEGNYTHRSLNIDLLTAFCVNNIKEGPKVEEGQPSKALDNNYVNRNLFVTENVSAGVVEQHAKIDPDFAWTLRFWKQKK